MPLVLRPEDLLPGSQANHDDWDNRLDTSGPEILKYGATHPTAKLSQNLQATCIIMGKDKLNPKTDPWSYDASTETATYKGSIPANTQDAWIRDWLADEISKAKDALKNKFEAKLNAAGKAKVMNQINSLSWPDPSTLEFRTKFPFDRQWHLSHGAGTGYYLGNNIVGTAGHCIYNISSMLSNPSDFVCVFGWSDGVTAATPLQCYEIERIILCDIPQWPNISDYHGYDWTRMSRLWDGALLKIKGNVKVPAATLALAPPTFGQLVYNIGAPITAALKVSIDGRVLRHQCLPIPKVPDSGPLCRLRDHHGRFTTTLDQFSGNSGGPVISTSSGEIVGHTVSTQCGATLEQYDLEKAWGDARLAKSDNWRMCEAINLELAKIEPSDDSFRVYPMSLRSFMGTWGQSGWIPSINCCCDKDMKPDGTIKTSGNDFATFIRHKWDTPDVYSFYQSGRVDRNALFMRRFKDLGAANVTQARITFIIQFIRGRTNLPSVTAETSLEVLDANDQTIWKPNLASIKQNSNPQDILYGYTIEVDITTQPKEVLDLNLANFCSLRFSQAAKWNELPFGIGMSVTFVRGQIPFGVERDPNNALMLAFPPNTRATAEDDGVKAWEEEKFRYAAGAGLRYERSTGTSRVYLAKMPFWTNPCQSPPFDGNTNTPYLPVWMQAIDPALIV